MRHAKHVKNALKALLSDDIANTDEFGVVCRHLDGKVALVDLKNQVGPFLTLDGSGRDRLDPSSPVVGVDDSVADLESHVTSTPSAVLKSTTYPQPPGTVKSP